MTQRSRPNAPDVRDLNLRHARATLQQGIAWATGELQSATSAEALLIVAWQLEQATAAARHLAIHALDELGLTPSEIADLPGVWMTGDQVIDEVLPLRRSKPAS